MNRTIKTRKWAGSWSGKLAIKADMAQASAPISYSLDGNEFDFTPFQTASARHDWTEAFRLVREWLASQAG